MEVSNSCIRNNSIAMCKWNIISQKNLPTFSKQMEFYVRKQIEFYVGINFYFHSIHNHQLILDPEIYLSEF